ncbi:MAG: hypothetical protein KIH44_012005 [Octadecabacter sp.]|nr:hypothetical protein [Octadecabacter sp.]
MNVLLALLISCSTMDSLHVGYAVGWTVDCRGINRDAQTCTIAWLGRPIDPAKHGRLTFEEISG